MFDKEGVIYLTKIFLYQTDICADCTVRYTDLMLLEENSRPWNIFVLKYQYNFRMQCFSERTETASRMI